MLPDDPQNTPAQTQQNNSTSQGQSQPAPSVSNEGWITADTSTSIGASRMEMQKSLPGGREAGGAASDNFETK